MKKFLLLILTLICSISLAACYSNESTKESKEEPTSQEESVLESVVESEESLSEEESVSEAESEESVSEAESEESVSEPESEEESASEAESESESVEATYTITFVVVTNMPNVTAPEALVVKEGDVVTLPTHVGEYKVECWINQATGEVFVGGEFTLCEDVTLVAVIPTETQPH